MTEDAFEIEIYQLVGDDVLQRVRKDGTGWEWGWAERARDWMDATSQHFAYRCLPLTIMNQAGLWLRNPVGFTAIWNGSNAPNTIDFHFDPGAEDLKGWISNLFGQGIITWNTPFLFRTKPKGSRLLVMGPANYFVENAQPLTGLIESDWMTMSFTMNWKVLAPNQPVTFEQGMPLMQLIPLRTNICKDMETAHVTYQRLDEKPELHQEYSAWRDSRRNFQESKVAGETRLDEWQKDYFRGKNVHGHSGDTEHHTKINHPVIHYSDATKKK